MERAALTAAEKRRLRNQQSARDSRKRQKEYVESLERKVAELQAEVIALRAKLSSGSASSGDATPPPMTVEAELRNEEREMVGKIKEQLQAKPEDRSPSDSLETLVDNYVKQLLSFSARRRHLVLALVDQLRRLIEPTAAEKFLIWGLQQPDSFFTEAGRYIRKRCRAAKQRGSSVAAMEMGDEEDAEEESNVLCALARRLDMSPGQHTRIMNLREHAPAVLLGWRRVLGAISQLQQEMEAVARPTQEITEQMKSSFTAEQVASFIVWIGTNKPIAQMLKSLWVPSPHVLSEIEARAATRRAAAPGPSAAGYAVSPGTGLVVGGSGAGVHCGAAPASTVAATSSVATSVAASCARAAASGAGAAGAMLASLAVLQDQPWLQHLTGAATSTTTAADCSGAPASTKVTVGPPAGGSSRDAPGRSSAHPSVLSPGMGFGHGERKRRRVELGSEEEDFLPGLVSPGMFDPRVEDALMDALQSSFLQ